MYILNKRTKQADHLLHLFVYWCFFRTTWTILNLIRSKKNLVLFSTKMKFHTIQSLKNTTHKAPTFRYNVQVFFLQMKQPRCQKFLSDSSFCFIHSFISASFIPFPFHCWVYTFVDLQTLTRFILHVSILIAVDQ